MVAKFFNEILGDNSGRDKIQNIYRELAHSVDPSDTHKGDSEKVDDTKVFVSYLGAQGEVVVASEILANDFGLSPQELTGKSLFYILPKNESYQYLNALNEVKSAAKSVEFEHVISSPEGLWYLLTSIQPIRSADSSFFGFQIVSQNITRWKKQNDELTMAKNNLEALSEEKNVLISSMSHEIRNPLHALLGYCDLLSEEINSDQGKKYLEKIKKNSDYLLRLLTDTLDLCKTDAKGSTPRNISFDLREIISEVSEVIDFKVDKQYVDFKVELDNNINSKGYTGDPYRIRQILLNVLLNAVKYTKSGYIFFETKVSDTNDSGYHNIEFTVRDTGIGIKRESLKYIFMPFNRESHAKKYQGTGLGLTITKKIVELMDGYIKVDSAPGSGSTFLIGLKVKMSDEF